VKADTLILQTRDDIIASETVGESSIERIVSSRIVYLDALGIAPT